jgi:hypothetical protein
MRSFSKSSGDVWVKGRGDAGGGAGAVSAARAVVALPLEPGSAPATGALTSGQGGTAQELATSAKQVQRKDTADDRR